MAMLNGDMLTADRFWEASHELLHITQLLKQMAKEEHRCSVVYDELADSLEEESYELAVKLRDFATRIDRSVPSRH